MMMRQCSSGGCSLEVVFKDSPTPEPSRPNNTGRHSREKLPFPKIDSRFCLDRGPSSLPGIDQCLGKAN
jgi:hypothetical protein